MCLDKHCLPSFRLSLAVPSLRTISPRHTQLVLYFPVTSSPHMSQSVHRNLTYDITSLLAFSRARDVAKSNDHKLFRYLRASQRRIRRSVPVPCDLPLSRHWISAILRYLSAISPDYGSTGPSINVACLLSLCATVYFW